jgi:hypothetical protein
MTGPGMTQAEAEAWVAEHGDAPPTPDICMCIGLLRGEVFGPFRTPREARAALDRKFSELAARGEPLTPGADCGSIIFVDPAHHALPTEGSLNG